MYMTTTTISTTATEELFSPEFYAFEPELLARKGYSLDNLIQSEAEVSPELTSNSSWVINDDPKEGDSLHIFSNTISYVRILSIKISFVTFEFGHE